MPLGENSDIAPSVAVRESVDQEDEGSFAGARSVLLHHPHLFRLTLRFIPVTWHFRFCAPGHADQAEIEHVDINANVKVTADNMDNDDEPIPTE